MLQEILAIAGIQGVDQFRYLGIELYLGQNYFLFRKLNEKLEKKHKKINSAYIDVIHKRQLITNDIFLAFWFEWVKVIDEKIVRLLWMQKSTAIVKEKIKLVAKKD